MSGGGGPGHGQHARAGSLPIQAAVLAAFVGLQLAATVVRPAGLAVGDAAPAPAPAGTALDLAAHGLAPLLGRLQAPIAALDWREFNQLVAAATSGWPRAAVVAWAPRVREGDREAYELDSGRAAYRSFRLNDGRDHAGRTRRSPRRGEHFPLELVHAPDAERLLGYDLAAQAPLARAASLARTTGSPQLVLDAAGRFTASIVLVVPVAAASAHRDGGVLVVALPRDNPAQESRRRAPVTSKLQRSHGSPTDLP